MRSPLSVQTSSHPSHQLNPPSPGSGSLGIFGLADHGTDSWWRGTLHVYSALQPQYALPCIRRLYRAEPEGGLGVADVQVLSYIRDRTRVGFDVPITTCLRYLLGPVISSPAIDRQQPRFWP